MSVHHRQTSAQFFERPEVENADFNLSASAVEPMLLDELLRFSPSAREHLDAIRLDYTPRHGSPVLRDSIANLYSTLKPDDILVTSGVDEGLGMVSLSLLNKGDRVVVLTPSYWPHLELPARFGAEVAAWRTLEEEGWVPNLDALRKLVAEPTRMVITAFPQNPTGFMPDKAFAAELVEIVTNSGAVLIADEIYAGLLQSSELGGSDLADQNDRVISLNGLSKTYGLAGLRVGWIASKNREAMSAIRKTRILFNAHTPEPMEFLAQIALDNKDQLYQRSASIVAQGLEGAKRFFAKHRDLFDWTPPLAGVLSFPKWLGPGGARSLSEHLIEDASIAFAPGECFDGGDNHLRLSIGQRSVPEGLERLDDFLEKNY